jgi:copper chaperone CopZ
MKITYNLKGMHCNSCAILIERELKDKVNDVSASYSKEKVEIDFDPDKISEKEIKAKIEELGYEIGYDVEEFDNEKRKKIAIIMKQKIKLFLVKLMIKMKKLSVP